jgi:Methyltransferase domain/C-methyltransferase C-terminal domain
MSRWPSGAKAASIQGAATMSETVIFRQPGLPVFQNKVYPSVESAKLAPIGDVELVQHPSSGLVHNRAFNPALLTYDPDYQNEQACSAAFRQHLVQVLDTILRNVKLEDVGVEIGCGKGYFLEMLCGAGADVYGYDPVYEGTNPRITKQYFGDGRMDVLPDYVVLRHVLEHIPEPWQFLDHLRAQCKATTRIYIEVPCFDWIVANNAIYDIFYEHVNYFTLDALRNAFTTNIEAGRFFGGQYIYLLADLSAFNSPQNFDGSRFEKLDLDKYLRPLLDKRIDRTRNIFVWGAGAKGVTFSNLLGRLGIPIRAIIDINPAKQKRFCGGSGIPIISPAMAVGEISDADVFVMNPVYLTEIRALVADVNANLISVA